jgi:hypothetical protein
VSDTLGCRKMKKGITNPWESLLVGMKGVRPEKITSKDGKKLKGGGKGFNQKQFSSVDFFNHWKGKFFHVPEFIQGRGKTAEEMIKKSPGGFGIKSIYFPLWCYEKSGNWAVGKCAKHFRGSFHH